MGFFDEIASLFSEEEIDKSFKIEWFGRSAVLVSGYRTIKTLTAGEVQLILEKGGIIKIMGSNLYIKKLEVGEVLIAGVVLNIEFSN